MKNQSAKAVVQAIAKLSIKITPLKVGSGLVEMIVVTINPLFFVFAMLQSLSR